MYLSQRPQRPWCIGGRSVKDGTTMNTLSSVLTIAMEFAIEIEFIVVSVRFRTPRRR
jgi:hypothetical protein